MSHFSIAGMQLSLPCGDNLTTIGEEITKTKKRFPWVDMIVLSELLTYGPEKKYAEKLPSKAEIFYCELAKKLDIWLIPGSDYEIDGDDIFNTTSVINNQGVVIQRYRKIYPFCPYETGVSCGQDFVVFDVPQGRIGVAICYDLWFPEVARSLVCLGAEVLIYPTLTGTIDRNVELSIAEATAAMNQCYVIAVNGLGDYGNGKSIIVAPDGSVIHQAGINKEIFPVEIDFALVRRNRERGLHGLGQPLKSFRDNSISFAFATKNNRKSSELSKLGELKIPKS
ncbi:carbon-nitrogen hydrolase family protein [Colwellia sp. MSW7]|uniref:Carbon-nitrogen hydrolase family protein n=1 Tax=Colwellia maritima TaxID=2912588 RepID=A0ABS9X1B9_9GAMM|nr:carbon-nitrogen hydrolase family protein [Colwellia maritima]MCI2283975.1 carbon-nitrogen hydrolase family protein [Colwellia maritima]